MAIIDLEEIDRIFATVGGRVFRTQEDLKETARELLRSYQPGEFVSAEDWFFLVQFVRRHPDAAEKIGAGIAQFQRRDNRREGWATAPGFWIIRVDGTEDSFSIYECLKDQPPTREKQFLDRVISCCRNSIARTVHEHKLIYFAGRAMAPCERLGKPISFSEASVDHSGEWPFIRIMDEWLEEVRLYFWELEIEQLDIGVQFRDPAIDQHFCQFHDARAVLMVIHKSQNHGAGGYRMKFVIPDRSK